jgi:hypothetical protein
MTSTTLYQGTLNQFSGGQTLTGSYVAPSAATSAGTITITFTSTTTGTLTLPNGTSTSIQRFTF